MGLVKIDLHKSDRALSARYTHTDASGETEYNAAGIARLLGDIYRMSAGAEYKGDLSATILRLDLEKALASRALTPRQRQVVALRYFAELTQAEAAAVLAVSQPSVLGSLNRAIDSIAAHMNGEDRQSPQLVVVETPEDTPLGAWVAASAMNDPRWWALPDDVTAELNAKFPPKDARFGDGTDYNSQEAAEYPYKTEWALEYHARREGLRPDVHPTFPYAGNVVDRRNGRKNRMAPAN